MSLKAVTEVQLTINSVSVSGNVQVIGSVSNIKFKDSVGFQYNWTGNPVGSFFIQGSLDYNAGLPQNQAYAGGLNPGNWNTITLSPTPTTSSGSSYLIDGAGPFSFPYIRTLYTGTSGSGVISGFIFAKSYG